MTLTDASNQRPDVLEKNPLDIGLPLPPPPPPPAPVNRGPIEVIDLTLSDSESSSAEDDDEDDDRFHDGMLASEQSEPGTTRDGDRDEGGDDDGDDEEGEYVEIPVDATARAKLRLAISSVSEAKLRQMILDLVDSVPAAEEALLRELITVQRDTRAVVARFETCANCDQEYDVGVENEENCCFHPGKYFHGCDLFLLQYGLIMCPFLKR